MGQLRLAMLRHSKGRVGGKCDLYSTFYSTYKASESIVCTLAEQDVSFFFLICSCFFLNLSFLSIVIQDHILNLFISCTTDSHW